MVTSGIPQGSVIGPVVFLAYINDIATGVRSSMRLFADDSKVYRIIYEENNEEKLQCDLNTLQKWSENWQLHFYPDKCEVLRVTHVRDHTRDILTSSLVVRISLSPKRLIGGSL